MTDISDSLICQRVLENAHNLAYNSMSSKESKKSTICSRLSWGAHRGLELPIENNKLKSIKQEWIGVLFLFEVKIKVSHFCTEMLYCISLRRGNESYLCAQG